MGKTMMIKIKRIILLIIVLIKNYKKFTKRKRANELLDDNYDYETKEPKTIN